MMSAAARDDHPTAAMVMMCYKHAGKIRSDAPVEQTPVPSDPEFQNSRGRREGDRRELFRQVKALGDKVDEGPYAIRNGPKAANDISFYQVDKPTTGKWAGRTFVSRRLSDNEQRLTLEEQVRVLAAIAADPQGASLLYGQTIGELAELAGRDQRGQPPARHRPGLRPQARLHGRGVRTRRRWRRKLD
ncbi:MAG: hypothetical protein IPK85_02780 [Gemmatimonadetes bacterium]|nr:hypothetical protein [Gemmatimonadota bacterium]